MVCPHCGLKSTTKRVSILSIEHPGPDASDAAIRAYYHKTAAVEDLKFMIRPTSDISARLRSHVLAALADDCTPAAAARLRTALRIERADTERAHRTMVWARLNRMRASRQVEAVA